VFSENIELSFKPYYFVDYHCFSQHVVASNSVLLESKGKLVMDGVTGLIVDSLTTMGLEPALSNNGPYIGCIDMQPQTVTRTSLPAQLPLSVIGAKVDSITTKNLAQIGLVRSLTLEYKYRTARAMGKKLLKPRRKDIEIGGVQPVKIPFITGTYRFKNHAYSRTVLASTDRIVQDQTSSCAYCRVQPILVCENCGAIACESHSKNCVVCGKNLCNRCVTSKGIFSKKYYCAEHKPED
jgi:hypothetical protein